MGMGFIALIVFILLIIGWTILLKRSIGEAMIVGFIVTALFGGTNAFQLIVDGIVFGATNQVLFAALAFVFMAYVIDQTGVITLLINIMNSILGRVPGGPAHVDTASSALFGMISGSGSGNAATTGAVTIPWMIKSNYSRELSATITAGNAGLGISLPPSSSMFILLGFAPIAAVVSEGSLYFALLIGGIYTILYRVILTLWFVKKHNIRTLKGDEITSFKKSFRLGWKSLFIFFGILIPLTITIGPISDMLSANPNIGGDAIGSISLIVWVPILITGICMVIGYKKLPKSFGAWNTFLQGATSKFSVIGVLLLFAFAASENLKQLGLSEDLNSMLTSLNMPSWLVIIIVGALIVLVAGPLSGTATLTAVGLVAFTALVSAGVDPTVAVVAILIFASTEGASPPSSAPIFIASGIAQAEPGKTFSPLIFYYVLPIFAIGVLVAMEILPLFV